MTINLSDKVLYLGAGVSIGFIFGALLAPSSGEEMRHNISTKVDDLTHKLQQKVQSSQLSDTATKRWNDVVERGKNIVSIGRQQLHDSIEEGKRRFNESIEDERLAER
jgi:gas vesicle protein